MSGTDPSASEVDETTPDGPAANQAGLGGDDPQDTGIRESDPNASGAEGLAGGMGVSSERVGPTGRGQEGSNGVRDTSPDPSDDAGDVPPEQRPGRPEDNPEGLEPKRTRD